MRTIFITGYPGAGKTHTVKQVMAASKVLHVWWKQDTPFADWPSRGRAKHHQIGTLCELDGVKFIAAGCHRRDVTNGQGADIFISLPSVPVLQWLESHGHTVLWDKNTVGLNVLKAATNPIYLYLDYDKQACMERRDARCSTTHHSTRKAEDLQRHYINTERRLAQAPQFAEVVKTKQPVRWLKNHLRTC